MLLVIRVLLSLTAAVLVAGAILWLWRKQRRSRRAEIEQAARQRRIDGLFELVDAGERDARLAADVAARLRGFVDQLRAESPRDS